MVLKDYFQWISELISWCSIPTEMIGVTDEVTDLLYLGNIGDELENESQNPDPACFTPVKE